MNVNEWKKMDNKVFRLFLFFLLSFDKFIIFLQLKVEKKT